MDFMHVICLKKLKHDADRLDIDKFDSKPDEFKYAFYDFVVTAYHLCDWVKKDNAIPISKKQIKQILDNNDIIKICRDLANAGKHYYIKLYSNSYSCGLASRYAKDRNYF